MKKLELLQDILGYLIVAIIFMLLGAFLQWDGDFFFNVGYGSD